MRKVLVATTTVLLFLLTPFTIQSQTQWFKYEGNPVLKAGSSGAWEGAAVTPGRVLLEDSVYHLWYSGLDNAMKLRVGHATSSDGVTWRKDTLNPILGGGPPNSWEDAGIRDVYVIHTAAGYRMWYTGDKGASYPWLYGIGYASSPDGIAWMKTDSANPVLTQASWYTRGPNTPSVLGPDSLGGYRMWFTGEPLLHQDFQIGYATATNDTSWTPWTNPVFSWGTSGSWDDDKVFCPRVLYNGEQYEMWYCGERSDGRTQIGYATSADGLSWTRSPVNPVLTRGAGWESWDLYGVEILFHENVYHMWYGGANTSATIAWRIGYAVSPKGFRATVSHSGRVPLGDTMTVMVHVDDPHGLTFVADIDSASGGRHLDTLRLYDDGVHGDSLSGDGLFANNYAPGRAGTYVVGVSLTLNDTLRFSEMESLVRFDVVTSVSEGKMGLPREHMLEQNYPNPFNPSTTIRYALPQRSFVTLAIYNMLGQKVAELVSGEQEPGFHEVRFDGENLSSGVYLYRLQAANFTDTKKLLLVR